MTAYYGPTAQQQYGQPYPQPLRDGGLVRGRTKQEVWQYPVAPGYVVTFVVEQENAISVFKKACLSSYEAPQIVEYPCDMSGQQKKAEQPQNDAMARLAALEKKVMELEGKRDEHDAE